MNVLSESFLHLPLWPIFRQSHPNFITVRKMCIRDRYYTGNTWGRAQNYHLCVDSSLVGVDGCLRAALAYLEDVCKDEEKPEDGEKETV